MDPTVTNGPYCHTSEDCKIRHFSTSAEAAHVEGGLQILQDPLLKRGGPRLGRLGVIYSLYMQASALSKNIF